GGHAMRAIATTVTDIANGAHLDALQHFKGDGVRRAGRKADRRKKDAARRARIVGIGQSTKERIILRAGETQNFHIGRRRCLPLHADRATLDVVSDARNLQMNSGNDAVGGKRRTLSIDLSTPDSPVPSDSFVNFITKLRALLMMVCEVTTSAMK